MARLKFFIAALAAIIISTAASPTQAVLSKPVGYEISRDQMCFATACFINCAYAACLYITVKTEDGKTSRFKINDYGWDTQKATTRLGESEWQFQSTGTGESQVTTVPGNGSLDTEPQTVACARNALQTKREVYLGTDKIHWRCQWPF